MKSKSDFVKTPGDKLAENEYYRYLWDYTFINITASLIAGGRANLDRTRAKEYSEKAEKITNSVINRIKELDHL